MSTKKAKVVQQNLGFELYKQAEEKAHKCFVCGMGVNNPYKTNGELKAEPYDGFYIYQSIGGDSQNTAPKWVHLDCAEQLANNLFVYLKNAYMQMAAKAGEA